MCARSSALFRSYFVRRTIDVFLMFNIIMYALLEIEHFRLAVHKCEQDYAVGGLQLCVLVQKVRTT